MSTILKWAGNKTAIMPELIKYLPAGSRLVEPFAGSCAVMMATDYPQYLIADVNPDLINLYRAVRDNFVWVLDMATSLFISSNNEVDYYNIREEFNCDESLSELWKAVYFIYLNRHCYRGLCRYNKNGKFNVPYGNYKKPYFPKKEITAFSKKAQRATFVCAGYDETLESLKSGDVVYCDPPYDGVFSSYHTNGFTEGDQRQLASILEQRASEGYSVIASNSDTQLTRSLYSAFNIRPLSAPRSMGVAAGEKKQANEIIAVSSAYQATEFDIAKPFSERSVIAGVGARANCEA